MFAIYDLATGAWDGVPADTDTHDEAHGARPIPGGWPDLYVWSPALPGFVAAPPPVELTRLGYQRLFTQAERIGIRASADPIVIDLREMAALAETVSLVDPDTVNGSHYLEAVGLIAAGRAAEILAGTAPA